VLGWFASAQGITFGGSGREYPYPNEPQYQYPYRDSRGRDVSRCPRGQAPYQGKCRKGAAHIVGQFTYMVAPHSDIQTMADVDRLGVRVVGTEGTAAVRAAQASLKNVTIFQAKSSAEVFELLRTGKADAMTSSRETLLGLSKKLPGSRVLDGSYLNSYVAIAVPKGRSAGLAYASAFVEDVKANGMVRRSLDNAGLTTTRVAPAGVNP